ncbi:MAG: hypothetical protein OJK14_27125 [Achromobacter sp.]|uniref:hypothetical protein n=1 Tax=Achromobacter sp. TaxID=134375 RepID=UPI00258436A2|nr:hypothetical protein [Achromobacter sp.]MCW0210788.1 hypothetical protein [Achromobacter sp.]
MPLIRLPDGQLISAGGVRAVTKGEHPDGSLFVKVKTPDDDIIIECETKEDQQSALNSIGSVLGDYIE